MDIIAIFIFLFGLCWGSFLNVVGYRLVTGRSFFMPRSHCASCNCVIHWYDNIPLISWLLLKGRCRQCKERISFLYPFIELLTAVLMVLLYKKCFSEVSSLYYYLKINPVVADFDAAFAEMANKFTVNCYTSFLAFFIFFTALIVSVRSDLQAMVIPQICTLWLAPLGFAFAFFGFTDISATESFVGAVMGYGFLWLIAVIFKTLTKREGVGVGDMELMALIGSFLGLAGAWFSLMVGSLSGVLIGGIYLFLSKKDKLTRIPFGPFLALGAIIYFFFEQSLKSFFWG